MEKSKSKSRETVFKVSLKERPDFKGDLSAFVFDSVGNLLSQAPVKANKVAFDLPREQIARARLFIAPTTETFKESPTPLTMHRLNAYEAQVAFGGTLIDEIGVPGAAIDIWPRCDCLVRGKVVRSSDNRGVCNARVHICEVEKIARWIRELAPQELFQLRKDLLVIIRNPPPPDPSDLGPVIGPNPYIAGVSPVPEPPAKSRPLYRFKAKAPKAAHRAALPQGMLSVKALGPQPIPPGVGGQMLSLPPDLAEFEAALNYPYPTQELQELLVENWKMVGMLLCQLQERIWRLRCDEVAVVPTDNQGRFEVRLSYPCVEDRPDYYFWVEYEFDAGYETVYQPSMACTTRWDYLCGSEVILPITDSRVPGCTAYPDRPGCEVVVLTIGNDVAIQQIQTDGAVETHEGLTTAHKNYGEGAPFGGTLEMRVDFSRSALREKDIKFYRWSYKRLSGPDGESTATANGSEPVSGDWTPLTRDVVRHYKDKDEDRKTIYSSYLVGPLPTTEGDRTAPKGNLFEIHPAYHPNYPDAPPHDDAYWVVLNQHVDLADAYFATASLPGSPIHGPTDEDGPAPEDKAAGRYELKLELFDKRGELVNWTDNGIELSIIDATAPFGSEGYETKSAPDYNRLSREKGGVKKLYGFHMVLRVDNNHCYAEVLPVGGDVEPNPECGFHTYESGDEVGLKFIAHHPNHFATFSFDTNRATGSDLLIARTFGKAGESAANGYGLVGGCESRFGGLESRLAGFCYQKLVGEMELRCSDLYDETKLECCANAAFGEHLDVSPMAQNGYSGLHYLHHEDTAAFALAEPCGRDEEGQ